MCWELHPDEAKLLVDIVHCCEGIGISSKKAKGIRDAYVELKKLIKCHESSPFCSDSASRYYQQINLTVLNKLWEFIFSAKRMEEIIEEQKIQEPYKTENFNAQLLSFYLSSFCASACTVLCLVYEEELCLKEKSRVKYGTDHPKLEKAKNFLINSCNANGAFLKELQAVRNSISHFFIASPFVPETDSRTECGKDKWVIPNPQTLGSILPEIVMDRER